MGRRVFPPCIKNGEVAFCYSGMNRSKRVEQSHFAIRLAGPSLAAIWKQQLGEFNATNVRNIGKA
jgi:hypothetical protein